MALTRFEAQEIIKALVALRTDATDAQASKAIYAFPKLKENGTLISAGSRINWNGTIKRAAVDLWDTAENNPDNAPALWEDINYREGYRVIPDAITAGTAFALDEFGWWKGVLYRSTIASNAYTPEQYPAGWAEVTTK